MKNKWGFRQMKNIEEECAKFMAMMGGDAWGEGQRNAMNASFYGGALVTFILLQHATSAIHEDDCVADFDAIYKMINKNIMIEKALMQKIWDMSKQVMSKQH